MILIIDNYDSFVHNLARYVRESGVEILMRRNDECSVEDCLDLSPSGIIISPGPKRPFHAGISIPLIKAMPETMPLLGVCLGHQCLVEVFGGQTVRSLVPVHGEVREISHDGTGLFSGVSSPTKVGRYHSLISQLPDASSLSPTAYSQEQELMAVAHDTRPWFGVQFHPESLLTQEGRLMIRNFLSYC